MSAQDQVYLHDNGDRAEVLIDPGLIHVVEMPYLQPARRVPKHGYLEPDRVGRAFLQQGYQRVREQPVARVLVDVAPDAVDQVKRGWFGQGEWARRLSKKTFLATLGRDLTRREAWALLRYVRLRHARVLVLDARVVSPLGGGSTNHRQPLRAWLEAIADDDGDPPLEEIVFRDCRFHRDEQDMVEAIVPRSPAFAFVGGLPRRLGAFSRVDTLTLGCRAPDGLVPAAAFGALRESDVDPVSLVLEVGRDQLAPEATGDAMLRWLTSKPTRRLRTLSLAGCSMSVVVELAESGLALERVRWQGRVTGAALDEVVQKELPFELEILAAPGSERGLAPPASGSVVLRQSEGSICPWG